MNRPQRTAGLLGVAAVLAAGLTAVASRRAGGAAGPAGRVRAASRRFRRSSGETHTCACGAEYRVAGTDRHRIYWPAGAPEHAPVLGARCVECEAPLPSGRAVAAISP